MLVNTYAVKIAPKSFSHEMRIGRFVAKLMKAPKIVDDGTSHGLPPGTPIPVYPVDALPGCPEDWVRGAGSYVCPIMAEWALWFDWRSDDDLNTAVLPSVKGLNPITGQKISGMKLEKYKEKCPVHEEEFKGSDRYCEKCNYKWPPQSYVSSPNVLWWDGFRQPDGNVRQFFFSEDDERDVASAIIGEKNTVPAFGFAFFEPKTRRERPSNVSRYTQSQTIYAQPQFYSPLHTPQSWQIPSNNFEVSGYKGSQKLTRVKGSDGPTKSKSFCEEFDDDGKEHLISDCCEHAGAAAADLDNLVLYCFNSNEIQTAGGDLGFCDTKGLRSADVTKGASAYGTRVGTRSNEAVQISNNRTVTRVPEQVLRDKPDENAKVAVGAGAIIRQELMIDPLAAEDWKEEPSGIIRLYFVFESKFQKIVEKGIKDLDGSSEGFLKGIPVG